ncbi:DMT family transporter [Mycobacterium sp. MYCO198283]|uniref:DMT family transporter n=1 Tax=Mycobacterium sp. MYCO198283 TaxID=2883505 RepID=UPI001E601678|nr:DMT family transporter [Mycobacterium sp. MYCO198283]MCG5433860.1 DMT family transporter [Mycobacterium sp. MYCO198283]
MARAEIAVVLALAAALCLAIGDVTQQRSAHEVTDEPVGNTRLLLSLLRDVRWWLGGAVAALGFGLQAAALGFGSVLLVQALLVTALLFALPINARITGRRVTRRQWCWAVALAAAVAVVVTVGNPTEGTARGSWQDWSAVIAVLAPVLLACVVGARLRPGPAAAVLLGVVSGALWGVFAVLMKGVVDRLADGLVALLTTPELYAWALVAVAATAWQQSSFRAGALTASLPTMTVTEPVVGSVLGVVVLGEALRPDGAGWIALVVAVTVTVVATMALARSEASDTPARAAGAAPVAR